MKYAVNEEGIEAMNTMASAITESVEELEDIQQLFNPQRTSMKIRLAPIKHHWMRLFLK